MMEDSFSSIFEYSIAGGMLFLSFVFVWQIIRSLNNRDRDRTIEFTRTITTIDEQHREERRMWSAAEDRRQQEANQVIKDLGGTIREVLDHIKNDRA